MKVLRQQPALEPSAARVLTATERAPEDERPYNPPWAHTLWEDAAYGTSLRRVQQPRRPAYAAYRRQNEVVFSPDSALLAAADLTDGGFRTWDVETGRHLRKTITCA